MKNYSITILLVFCFSSLGFAQLSGFAYLNGQTNHANITVKFLAISPAAITDSVFTAADGSYSINITGGVYQVIFTKSNYQNIYYNSFTALALTNTVVLNTQTLVPGNFYGVSGNVFGTWTSNSTYFVTDNCTVPLGNTLTIQPGTIIKFNGNYSLTVKGSLTAVGNSSQKIVFTSAQNNPKARDWSGIYLENSASHIKDCFIEYAFIGVSGTAGSLTVENCEIKSSTFGISLVNNNNSTLKNNLIWNLLDSYYSCGIIIEGQSSTLVECNTLHSITGVGIRVMSGVSIKNNHVYNISKGSTSYGWGIWSYYSAFGKVENNYVHNCVNGVAVGDSPSSTITPTIVNNVLTNNTTGIRYVSQANGVIANNIIANNQYGIVDYQWAGPSSILNNLFWNNSTSTFSNVSVVGLGQITGSNTAGHANDSYNNLFEDPLLISGSPFYTNNSPCINSGKTQYSSNIGVNANTFCQGMIMGIKTEDELKSIIQVFPNPFQDQLFLTNISVKELKAIELFDIQGKHYLLPYSEISENAIQVNSDMLQPGFYFLKINQNNFGIKTIKIIKN